MEGWINMGKTAYGRHFGNKQSYFGADAKGHDVKAFGDTTGKYYFWDASEDTFYIVGNLSVTGTITETGNRTQIGTFTVGKNDSGHDVKFFGATSGKYFMWDESADSTLIVGDVNINSSFITYSARDMIDIAADLRTLGRFVVFDDFNYQTLAETDTPWILNKGSDGTAADPAISTDERGKIVLTAGAGDGSTAQDGSQIVCAVPVQADSGNLVFETRLHINTAITGLSVIAGFTDVTTLEEPATIAAATITTNASDMAAFVYDDGATTKEWYAVAVDGDTDDTGNATTGSAPVADTYQTLRIEVSADGATIKFYVDGVLKKTLSGAAGVSPDVNLYATVCICGTGEKATVDVDYIYVGHDR